MAYNKAIWNRHFEYDDFPNLLCPVCSRGKIGLIQQTFKVKESAHSIADHGHDDFEPDWVNEQFSCLALCDVTTCGQTFAISGRRYNGEFYDENGPVIASLLNPKSIFPAPLLIVAPEETTIDVKKAIQTASELYWADLDSCANRLRTCVEIILDDMGIPRSTPGKTAGKKARLNLDARIKLFEKTDEQNASFMDSLRVFGNLGSHGSEVDENVLADALQLLDAILDEIYGKKTQKLKELQASVKAYKGKHGGSIF